ncbi:hypothetical protein JB92DRAFT_2827904 [Gautieria morchelliformis]|nr:hypothetical protein JB92DRAFT_2827904 [Gautieria morchelliformis]
MEGVISTCASAPTCLVAGIRLSEASETPDGRASLADLTLETYSKLSESSQTPTRRTLKYHFRTPVSLRIDCASSRKRGSMGPKMVRITAEEKAQRYRVIWDVRKGLTNAFLSRSSVQLDYDLI